MTNSISFDSYFSKTIVDNNGISVADINAGLSNLYTFFGDNADSLFEAQRYFVSDYEAGYPDLVAKNSILKDQQYWWWVLLLNRLDNPFEDLKPNWVYAINSSSDINNFINNSETANESQVDSRIGSIVELN